MASTRALDAMLEANGGAAADWLVVLAQACDRDTQVAVSKLLGISATAVNTVLRGRYGAATTRVEALVRGRLMAGKVICPEMGELATDLCREWQGRAARVAINNLQRRMRAACRACPQSRYHQEEGK